VNVELCFPAASAVIYGGVDSKDLSFENIEQALAVPDSDIRLFGKPESFERRRMGVALATGKDVEEARARAQLASSLVKTKAN
jgi:phosphoribosylglycinamide formyltransferase 2